MPAGICAISGHEDKNVGKILLFLSFYHQHFCESWSGLGISDGDQIISNFGRGHFRSNFTNIISDFSGNQGIGYCGPCQEPLQIDTKLGEFYICFSGNLTEEQREELKNQLKGQGISFSARKGDSLDIEIIANLIAQGKNIVDGIKKMSKKVKGYTVLILTKDKIFAARSPDGHWVLTIAENENKEENSVVIVSTTTGVENLDYKILRDLEPGEIISLKGGNWKREEIITTNKINICSFLSVYTDFVTGTFQTGNVLEGSRQRTLVSFIREKLGASLARRDIEVGFIPDLVLPVKDSGISAALGYYHEFWQAWKNGEIDDMPLYVEVLVKYAYSGRSFTISDREKRHEEAYYKILTGSNETYIKTLIEGIAEKIGKDIKELIVVLVDDSVVRGTQIGSNLIPKLEKTGIKIIHFKSSFPLIFFHCPWSKSTKKGECLAAQIFNDLKGKNIEFELQVKIEEEVARFFKIATAKFNTIEDLVKAINISRENLCLDCILPPNY